VLHLDGLPGFFDGQFQALYELDPSAYDRLTLLAWDPRAHSVLRCLAVMAMHEPRRADLPARLVPLLVRPSTETRAPQDAIGRRDLSDDEERLLLSCRLSQYARFSLAKAGVPEFIQDKIACLRDVAEEELALAYAYRSAGYPEAQVLLRLDLAMSLQFDLGYHFQQLDLYDQAEAAYAQVLARPEELGTKRWVHYNLACIHSIRGRLDDAIGHLRLAVATGFDDFDWAARDGDLAPLRGDERFRRILAGLDDAPAAEDGR
jgi:tetratricopeptide (TPR) repeat protein